LKSLLYNIVMKKEKINIKGCVLYKTFSYLPKFNNLFFDNFISREEEIIDTHFSFTVLNALIALMQVCLKQQGLDGDKIEGEFIRHDTYVLVNSKLMYFVEQNISDRYYINLFSTIDMNYTIVESNINEDIIYLMENNNCVKIYIDY